MLGRGFEAMNQQRQEIDMTGKIKMVNAEKGFGFIAGEDGVEYFFHRSALQNCQMEDLTKNRHVTFEPSEGTKGPRAEDVNV